MQVGGGLVVVSTGALLRHSDDDDATQDAKRPCNEANYLRQAFYPLTLPLTVRDAAGNFYGTAAAGGFLGYRLVYKLKP